MTMVSKDVSTNIVKFMAPGWGPSGHKTKMNCFIIKKNCSPLLDILAYKQII